MPLGREMRSSGMKATWDTRILGSGYWIRERTTPSPEYVVPALIRRACRSSLELLLEFCELLLQIGKLPLYFLHLDCELGQALVRRLGIRTWAGFRRDV